MFGLKIKRTAEEKKVFDEKVYNTTRDHTVTFLSWVFRKLHIDDGLWHLQQWTSAHRKTTVGLLGGLMTVILVWQAVAGFNGKGLENGTGTMTDSLMTEFLSLPSYYKGMERKAPDSYAREILQSLNPDTARYRTDSLYRKELNRLLMEKLGYRDLETDSMMNKLTLPKGTKQQ